MSADVKSSVESFSLANPLLNKDKKKFHEEKRSNTVLTCHKTSVERLLIKMANPGDLQETH